MGLIDGILGFFGAREQNASAKQIAADQNRLAVELASTQHQREVADLKAAGLNPILSAGGSGSAVPNLTTPQVSNVFDKFGGADESARQAYMLKQSMDNLKADTVQKTENAKLAQENQGVATEMRQKTVADYWKTDAEKNLTRQLEVNAKKDNLKKDKEIQLLEAQTSSARAQASIQSLDAQAAQMLGVTNKVIQQGAGSARAVFDAGSSLKDIFFPKKPTQFNFNQPRR